MSDDNLVCSQQHLSQHYREATERLKRAGTGATLRDAFAGCSHELWYWVLTEGRRSVPAIRDRLPTLPDESYQARFCALHGDDAFRQAVNAVAVFRDEAQRCGLDLTNPSLRVMDFGCGWGRITQMLMRDAHPYNLVGVDVQQEALEMCAKTGLKCPLVLCSSWPPLKDESISDESFDLVVAYSVFSHLSQENHIAWVEELFRKIRRGGVLVVTTRPRSFIDVVEHLRSRSDLPPHAYGAAASFKDAEAWRARYDAGEFCFDVAGGGGGDLKGFYGEALVPLAFVERAWTQFSDFVGMITVDKHRSFDQNVIYGRKA